MTTLPSPYSAAHLGNGLVGVEGDEHVGADVGVHVAVAQPLPQHLCDLLHLLPRNVDACKRATPGKAHAMNMEG